MFAGAFSPFAGLDCCGKKNDHSKRRHFGSCFTVGTGGELKFKFCVSCLCNQKLCRSRSATFFGNNLFSDCQKSGCSVRFVFGGSGLGVTRGKNVASSQCVAGPLSVTRNGGRCSTGRVPAQLDRV